MTELQWLIKILTQHKLPNILKDLFIERIGEVEINLVPKAHGSRPIVNFGPVTTSSQAPSTQKILDEMAQETEVQSQSLPTAHTPAAAAALRSRQEAIKAAASDKPEAGRTSPRKF